MSETPVYPIAEFFHSIQGEGLLSGVPTFFIRLAGCNVGRAPILGEAAAPGFTICTDWKGNAFPCDTNYRLRSGRMTPSELCGVYANYGRAAQNVCLTGGEPLMHDLSPLVREFYTYGYLGKFQIETSGTKPLLGDWREDFWDQVHVTCSPKQGFLPENLGLADEFKFIVQETDGPAELTARKIRELLGPAYHRKSRVFIMAVNGYNALNLDNCAYATEVARIGDWRVGIQLHKILSMP